MTEIRQRGYQDDDRDRAPRPAGPRPAPEPGAPAGARRISQDAPRTSTCPGSGTSCAARPAGTWRSDDIGFNGRCSKCGTELHSCAQCVSFDPASRFECAQPVPERVSPKERAQRVPFFSPRTTVERETTTPRNNDARKAFDDLFKF